LFISAQNSVFWGELLKDFSQTQIRDGSVGREQVRDAAQSVGSTNPSTPLHLSPTAPQGVLSLFPSTNLNIRLNLIV